MNSIEKLMKLPLYSDKQRMVERMKQLADELQCLGFINEAHALEPIIMKLKAKRIPKP